MQVKNKATGEAYFVGQFEMLGAMLSRLQLESHEAIITLDPHEAAQYAGVYISRFYPVYKQLNVLRSGLQVEREKMDAFIDACRAWSNGNAPQLNDLALIVP